MKTEEITKLLKVMWRKAEGRYQPNYAKHASNEEIEGIARETIASGERKKLMEAGRRRDDK